MTNLEEYIKENFRYDPETGILYRSLKCSSEKAVGYKRDGYLRCTIKKKSFNVHRICWFLHSGKWPDDQVDHIDGDRSNNKISNLRSATNQQNCFNTKKYSNNRSGFKGVSFHKKSGKWRAQIRYQYVIHLGYFDKVEEASAAYEKKAEELFGDFKRKS